MRRTIDHVAPVNLLSAQRAKAIACGSRDTPYLVAVVTRGCVAPRDDGGSAGRPVEHLDVRVALDSRATCRRHASWRMTAGGHRVASCSLRSGQRVKQTQSLRPRIGPAVFR